MTAARPDVCVVSGGDEVRYRSYVNHTVYARLDGFTHHIGIGLAPGITSRQHYKLQIDSRQEHDSWISGPKEITSPVAGHKLSSRTRVGQGQGRSRWLGQERPLVTLCDGWSVRPLQHLREVEFVSRDASTRWRVDSNRWGHSIARVRSGERWT